MTLKVTTEINTYEESAPKKIKVLSHWNQNCFVLLDIDGVTVTIKGSDLIEAAKNCMNIRRHG